MPLTSTDSTEDSGRVDDFTQDDDALDAGNGPGQNEDDDNEDGDIAEDDDDNENDDDEDSSADGVLGTMYIVGAVTGGLLFVAACCARKMCFNGNHGAGIVWHEDGDRLADGGGGGWHRTNSVGIEAGSYTSKTVHGDVDDGGSGWCCCGRRETSGVNGDWGDGEK